MDQSEGALHGLITELMIEAGTLLDQPTQLGFCLCPHIGRLMMTNEGLPLPMLEPEESEDDADSEPW